MKDAIKNLRIAVSLVADAKVLIHNHVETARDGKETDIRL